jgi:uncharacterized membrane protein YfcA
VIGLEPLLAVLSGLGAGLVSGLLGIGGALLTTPVVRLVFERPALVAVGTPLLIVIPTTASAAMSHARAGTVDLRAGGILGLAGAPFAALGALGAEMAGGGTVLVATAALLALVAVKLWRGRDVTPRQAAPDAPAWRLLLLGAAAGAMSGLMGLGGGFVIVPGLVSWFRYPMVRAAGTSLVGITILAIPGAAAHLLLGHVDPTLALWLAVGVVPGALGGAWLAQRVSGRLLRRMFAALMLGAAALLAGNELSVMLGG